MITIQSSMYLERTRGGEIFDFLIRPTDHDYQRWWPGTHLELHVLQDRPGNVGSVVYMDEWIGDRRVKMTGIIVEAERGKRIVWQLKQFVRLPVWLVLELEEAEGGVTLTHTIRAGFGGAGRMLDGLFRAYFSPDFERSMDAHFRSEFPRLSALLHSRRSAQRLN